ncbi:hypothetical protein BGZ70_001238 [Mortierella alpina]|uniref:Galactose oxidase n=1 Tax=Mortierella alpina TaxID=64518 RepID=A0A9P6IY40_MORAP|nr:hypothetical protein BGZ70_001238 [Mortierella alpina]
MSAVSVKVLFVVGMMILCTHAQPQPAPIRATRAITLIDADLYLYGGSSPSGTCFSDLYHLHLDPKAGWADGLAPWVTVDLRGAEQSQTIALNSNSWAVGVKQLSNDSDGDDDDHQHSEAIKPGLYVYGQTLCPNDLAQKSASPHAFTSSSKSAVLQLDGKEHGSQSQSAGDILGPRLTNEDEPVPIQVVDQERRIVYTFVYDANEPDQRLRLYSFSADHPSLELAKEAKNMTMHTPGQHSVESKQEDEEQDDEEEKPKTAIVTDTAPYIDIGSTVYWNETIIVLGGGKAEGRTPLTGKNVNPVSRLHKMDRCWLYDIASDTWSVRYLTSPVGTFPPSRRLAALVVVNDKIYMHGGYTRKTQPTVEYANDLWILDTTTWQWTAGSDSPSGRSSHTLVSYQGLLLSVSGFRFRHSMGNLDRNALIMIYNITSDAWSMDFGKLPETFLTMYPIVVILALVGSLLFMLITASALWSYWGRVKTAPAFDQEKAGSMLLNVPGTEKRAVSLARRPRTVSPSRRQSRAGLVEMVEGSTGSLSQNSNSRDSLGYELPLPPLPKHFACESQGSLQQQQQVPLMSDDALEQSQMSRLSAGDEASNDAGGNRAKKKPLLRTNVYYCDRACV